MRNLYTALKKTLPLVVVLLLLGFQNNASAQLMKTDPEGVALMAIYNATDGANWTNHTNWGSDTEPLSNWYGVTVEGGKVTKLRLVTNNLTGSLPDVFDALPDLYFLHLKENNLTGSVPSTLGDLVNLRFLGLNDNDFSGPFPSIFTNLTELTEVYIQENGFTGEFPDISAAVDLKYLYFFDNEFSSIHAGLQTLPILRELIINDNYLTFSDLIPLKNLASNRFVYAPQGMVGNVDSQSKLVGEAFSVSYQATAQTNDSYVWYKDGSVIPGASAFTYSIPSVVLGSTGVYHVVVTNTDLPDLTLTGAATTLTVTAGPSDFPDWYLTSESNGDLAVVIDDPAVTSPATTKAYVWVEEFTGSAFEFVKYSPAIIFSASGPYTWNSNTTLKASTQTQRVKIQLENASLVTGDLSDMQQSIHLTVNEGNNSQINLIWTKYLGRDIDYYEVWAGNVAGDVFSQSGSAVKLATLPNTETTFTDFTVYDYYTIVAVFPSTPLKNGGVTASKSNLYSVKEDGFANLFEPRMKIYPNPVIDMAMIEFDNAANDEFTVYLLDLSGRILRQDENITGTTYQFNRGNLKTGIYLVQMVGQRTIQGKIIIE